MSAARWAGWAVLCLTALGGCETKRPVVKEPQLATPSQTEPATRAARSAADARCGECHAQIVADYRRHPMGKSLATIAAAEAIESYGAEADLPFDSGGYRYEASLVDGEMLHRELRLNSAGDPVAKSERKMAYAVGSGRRGRSYLLQEGDRLFMSPLTYYPRQHRWDLSPGYEKNNSHFGRPIIGACLYCHAGETHWDSESLNRYDEPIFAQESIGCHRCHGPGEAHVRKHSAPKSESGTADDSIVNPARLAADRALDVCAQCHLSGVSRVVAPDRRLDDFVPGERLRESLAIYLERRDHATRFVSHVEQMKESRCFIGSEGKLRCTSCHDPHRAPEDADKVAVFRNRCLKCHADRGCSAPDSDRAATAPADNCLACHMPALDTEIRHAAVSDHRVPRRPIAKEEEPVEKPLGISRLIPFDRTALEDPAYPHQRNAGLALMFALDLHDREPRPDDLAAAARSLEDAVLATPDDHVAREALGAAYLRLNESGAALAHYQHILRDHPRREFSISGAARAAAALGRNQDAADYWRAAAELNPALPLYTIELARTLARLQDWRACGELCRSAIARFPESFVLRQLSIESHLGLKDYDAAEREMAELLQLNPPGAPAVRRWYDEHPLRKR